MKLKPSRYIKTLSAIYYFLLIKTLVLFYDTLCIKFLFIITAYINEKKVKPFARKKAI